MTTRPLLLLTQEQIEERIKELDAGWHQDGKAIVRDLTFRSFMETVEFVNRVAAVAEELDHHPDMTISYRDLKFSISTRYKGGLTVRDFRLAKRIDALLKESQISGETSKE